MNQSGQNLGAHVVSSLVDYNTGREAQEGLGRERKRRLGKGGYSIDGKNHMYSKSKDNKMNHKKTCTATKEPKTISFLTSQLITLNDYVITDFCRKMLNWKNFSFF